MTTLSDFIATVKDTINRTDVSDAVVTSWIMMAEERMNNELRCKEMIGRDTINVQAVSVALPYDWLETEYLKYVPSANAQITVVLVNGTTSYVNYDILYGRNLRYCTPDEFNAVSNDPNHPDFRRSMFTIIGNEIWFNPVPDTTNGTMLEMGYTRKIPSLIGGANLIYNRFPSLYLFAALSFSASYLSEDDRIATWAAQAMAIIQAANDAWSRAKYGKGPLHLRKRSFG